MDHLFLFCNITRHIWNGVANEISFTGTWEGENIISAWEIWSQTHAGSNLPCLPLIICWAIWLARNKLIFENGSIYSQSIITKIIASYHELPEYTPPCTHSLIAHDPIDHSTPWAFFDGAAQQHGCGGGFILHISKQHYYTVKMDLGVGTNNYAKLISLRHLMHFALNHDC